MKRIIIAFIVFILLFSSCSSKPAKLELSKDGCIYPLKWGMTEEEARHALRGYKLSDTTISGNKLSFSYDAILFDQTSLISVFFYKYTKNDIAILGEETKPLLSTIVVLTEDKELLNREISSVLGQQKTQRIAYIDINGDISSESVGELFEEERYWCSEESLHDVFKEETLRKIIPVDINIDEKEFYKFCDKRAYRIDWDFQDNNVILTFNGSVEVIIQILEKTLNNDKINE